MWRRLRKNVQCRQPAINYRDHPKYFGSCSLSTLHGVLDESPRIHTWFEVRPNCRRPSTQGNGCRVIPPGLAALTRHRNFILYRSEPDAISGKLNKVPLVSVTDPTKWLSHDDACRLAGQQPGISVGFVLCESVKIAVVDVDGCRNPQWGDISHHAQAVMVLLPGAYVEVSVSGTGLHFWFSYSGEMPAHACKANGVEFYHDKRFFALGSPYAADGSVETDLTMMLPALISTFVPPSAQTAGGEHQEWTTAPDPDWSGPTEDGELLRRALNSTSPAAAFDPKKPSFADLWEARAAKLSLAYPGGANRPYDASSADAALAQHLSFWCGRDCARIQRLMEQSALVREKVAAKDFVHCGHVGAGHAGDWRPCRERRDRTDSDD